MSPVLLMQNEPKANQTADERRDNVAAIIREVLGGNRDAFEELVFLYRDQVYMAAWQLTRNTDDAMDVSQEVFVRVYRALSSFKGNAKFSTWLHRIVLNTCVDYVRRQKRHWDVEPKADSSSEDEVPPIEPSVEPNQRELVYQREVQRKVLAALDKISARQRQVFLLRYYNELNLKEIAGVLRCTEGAIKRHLFRAQERLRIILKEMKRP